MVSVRYVVWYQMATTIDCAEYVILATDSGAKVTGILQNASAAYYDPRGQSPHER